MVYFRLKKESRFFLFEDGTHARVSDFNHWKCCGSFFDLDDSGHHTNETCFDILPKITRRSAMLKELRKLTGKELKVTEEDLKYNYCVMIEHNFISKGDIFVTPLDDKRIKIEITIYKSGKGEEFAKEFNTSFSAYRQIEKHILRMLSDHYLKNIQLDVEYDDRREVLNLKVKDYSIRKKSNVEYIDTREETKDVDDDAIGIKINL